MTKDESRAVAFLGVLLCLALVARYINRPGPVTINAGAVDIEALREAGRSLAQSPAPRTRARAAKPPTPAATAPPRQPERWTEPAWQRGAAAPDYGSGSSKESGRIDINRATAVELESLPGIGPAVAKRIVARRDSIGRFETLADLDAVKGIGPALLRKIEPYVKFRSL